MRTGSLLFGPPELPLHSRRRTRSRADTAAADTLFPEIRAMFAPFKDLPVPIKGSLSPCLKACALCELVRRLSGEDGGGHAATGGGRERHKPKREGQKQKSAAAMHALLKTCFPE